VIDSVPKYLNEETQATLARCGQFIYDADEPGDDALPFLPPYEFENQAVYVG